MLLRKSEWLIAFMMVEISAYTTKIVSSTCQLIYTFFHYFLLRYWFTRTNHKQWNSHNESYPLILYLYLKIFERMYHFSEKSIYTSYTFSPKRNLQKISSQNVGKLPPRRGPNFLLENTAIENSYPRKRFLSEDSSSVLPSSNRHRAARVLAAVTIGRSHDSVIQFVEECDIAANCETRRARDVRRGGRGAKRRGASQGVA